MQIALYQPDIPQNTGTILRMASCLGTKVNIIEPAGFSLNDKALKRAGMDYISPNNYKRHCSYDDFLKFSKDNNHRLVLLSTKVEDDYCEFEYSDDDILLFGRESAGVPDFVFQDCDKALTIKMVEGYRSLNIAMSCAMVVGEAMRQLRSGTLP